MSKLKKAIVSIDAISGLNLIIGGINDMCTGFFTSKVRDTEGWKMAHQPGKDSPEANAI